MKIAAIILLFIISSSELFSQSDFIPGNFSGNFQIDAQSYTTDSLIGAINIPDEKILSNSFLNLIYNHGNFEAGLRYEAYLNPILGFDTRYQGQGISYRYATYRSENLDLTAGDFYEQFGSGLIFRTYEERQLGLDNALDGLRFKLRPTNGIEFTGLIGKQRSFWDKGEGIVRGADASFSISTLFPEIIESNSLDFGASIISKYQPDNSVFYYLPENVFAYSFRMAFGGSNYNLNGEWAYKINDPNTTNDYNYNPGTGLIINASYFDDGIGINLNLHRIDNMDFRSDNAASGNNLNLNFIPPLTKQVIYRFATLYPYSTKLNGEIGYQFEFTYNLPAGSSIGGEYGTDISFNMSQVISLDTTHTSVDPATGFAFKYDSPFLAAGDLYYRDFHVELSRRLSEIFKLNFNFINFKYQRDILENEGVPRYGFVSGNIFIADILLKLSQSHSLRFELEYLTSKQDSSIQEKDFTHGDWFMLLTEYTFAPSLYISTWFEFNHVDESLPDGTNFSRGILYPNASVTIVHNTLRFSLGHGRQRGGLLCVGGVCRPVPSSNGFFLSLSSSF